MSETVWSTGRYAAFITAGDPRATQGIGLPT